MKTTLVRHNDLFGKKEKPKSKSKPVLLKALHFLIDGCKAIAMTIGQLIADTAQIASDVLLNPLGIFVVATVAVKNKDDIQWKARIARKKFAIKIKQLHKKLEQSLKKVTGLLKKSSEAVVVATKVEKEESGMSSEQMNMARIVSEIRQAENEKKVALKKLSEKTEPASVLSIQEINKAKKAWLSKIKGVVSDLDERYKTSISSFNRFEEDQLKRIEEAGKKLLARSVKEGRSEMTEMINSEIRNAKAALKEARERFESSTEKYKKSRKTLNELAKRISRENKGKANVKPEVLENFRSIEKDSTKVMQQITTEVNNLDKDVIKSATRSEKAINEALKNMTARGEKIITSAQEVIREREMMAEKERQEKEALKRKMEEAKAKLKAEEEAAKQKAKEEKEAAKAKAQKEKEAAKAKAQKEKEQKKKEAEVRKKAEAMQKEADKKKAAELKAQRKKASEELNNSTASQLGAAIALSAEIAQAVSSGKVPKRKALKGTSQKMLPLT